MPRQNSPILPLVEFHTRNINSAFDETSKVGRVQKGKIVEKFPGAESTEELTLIYPKLISLEEQLGPLGSKIILNFEQVLSIFKDLACALKKLHIKNILFLALKPSNVFLVPEYGSYVIGRSHSAI